MDIRSIDLNLLLVFEIMMMERNVTKAAERLGLSQPAVSSAISRLRQILNDPLFVRTGRGMHPTPRALELIGPYGDALDLIRSTLKRDVLFDPASSRRSFQLMLSDIGEIIYLPRLIAAVRSKAPSVQLAIRPLDRGRLAEELTFGTVDLAIGAIGGRLDGLRSETLFHETFACLGGQQTSPISTLDDYLDRYHLLIAQPELSGGGTLRALDGIVQKALDSIGRSRKVALSIPHFVAAPMIVARTDLLLTVPKRLAAIYQQHESMIASPLPFDVPSFGVSSVWHRHATSDPGNEWLRRLVAELFQE